MHLVALTFRELIPWTTRIQLTDRHSVTENFLGEKKQQIYRGPVWHCLHCLAVYEQSLATISAVVDTPGQGWRNGPLLSMRSVDDDDDDECDNIQRGLATTWNQQVWSRSSSCRTYKLPVVLQRIGETKCQVSVHQTGFLLFSSASGGQLLYLQCKTTFRQPAICPNLTGGNYSAPPEAVSGREGACYQTPKPPPLLQNPHSCPQTSPRHHKPCLLYTSPSPRD